MVASDTNFLSGVLDAANLQEPQSAAGGLLYVTGIGGDGLTSNDNVLTLSLNGFSLPSVTNSPTMVAYLNEKRKFAGLPEYEDITATFREYLNYNTVSLLLAWRRQVYDPRTGTVGLKQNYAKPGHIDLFAPDGSNLRRYTLQSVWPSAFSHGEIEMGGEDKISVSLTLAIDKAIEADGYV